MTTIKRMKKPLNHFDLKKPHFYRKHKLDCPALGPLYGISGTYQVGILQLAEKSNTKTDPRFGGPQLCNPSYRLFCISKNHDVGFYIIHNDTDQSNFETCVCDGHFEIKDIDMSDSNHLYYLCRHTNIAVFYVSDLLICIKLIWWWYSEWLTKKHGVCLIE